jgi:intracellular sulfur oxidation DsrE/DsrF family protein
MSASPVRSVVALLAAFAAAALSACASETPTSAAPPIAAAAATAASAPAVRQRAVFAISDADPQKWALVLGNVGNALDGIGESNAEFELIVYGPAIGMLLKDSRVADKVAAAVARGVHVVACRNSMRASHIDASQLVPGVDTVASGVVELIRLQLAGWAYVRS